MLPDRRQIVLKMLINEYIARALPIGSRTLIDRYHLGVSSATVRNELSRLEEAGYLTSPHTSSGRVPTDFGYRVFVNDLLENLSEAPSTEILNDLLADAAELDDLLDRTSQVLSRFTDCLAMVVPQGLISVSVMRITLVQLASNRLLAVIIGEDGSVFKRPIETNEEVTLDRLVEVESALNEIYAGSKINPLQSDVSSEQVKGMNRISKLRQDPLLLAIEQEVLDACATSQTRHAHTLGLSRLLNQPEFSNATRLSPLIEKLEDETILINLIGDARGGEVPLVRIGHENESDELSDISIVATPYGMDGQEGMIAVIGPTRMNYEQVINAVRAARTLLQEQ